MTLYSGPLPRKITPQPIVTVEVAIAFAQPDDQAVRLLRLHRAVAKQARGMELAPVSWVPQGTAALFSVAETKLGLPYSSAKIRPDSVQFDYAASYPGWQTVRDELGSIVRNLGSDLCGNISELSVRYINFFAPEQGMQDVIHLDFTTPFGSDVTRRWFRFQADDGGVRHDITCAEGVSVESSSEQGVILDIASITNIKAPDAGAVIAALDQLHDQEKRVFMSMITSGFLSKLEVAY